MAYENARTVAWALSESMLRADDGVGHNLDALRWQRVVSRLECQWDSAALGPPLSLDHMVVLTGLRPRAEENPAILLDQDDGSESRLKRVLFDKLVDERCTEVCRRAGDIGMSAVCTR